MDRFERTVDAVTITADVGIVTGRERLLPAEGSELRRAFGDATLERRFTNVHLYQADRSRLLARQATPVAVRPSAPPRTLLLGGAPAK